MKNEQAHLGIFDWGAMGQYEVIAPAMAPGAAAALKTAQLRPGERVLDIGCGTGSLALLAGSKGATVTGIDPSPRLLALAADAAAAAGLDVRFLHGDAEALPLPDNAFDLVADNFSLMFVSDRERAIAEMVRVLAPGGRIAWTSWISTGTIVDWVKASNAAIAEVLGKPLYSYTQWYDANAIAKLFAIHGFNIKFERFHLRYEAPSVDAWLSAVATAHPLIVAGNEVLARAGRLEEVNEQLRHILEDGNEAAEGFAVTPHYLVGVATRS